MICGGKDDVSLSAGQGHWIEESSKSCLRPVSLAEGKSTQEGGAMAVHGEGSALGGTLETPPTVNLIVGLRLT